MLTTTALISAPYSEFSTGSPSCDAELGMLTSPSLQLTGMKMPKDITACYFLEVMILVAIAIGMTRLLSAMMNPFLKLPRIKFSGSWVTINRC